VSALRGRKHDALLHGHVLPFVVDEVANDVGHILAHEILIAQDALDRLRDLAQTLRSRLVLGFKIADRRRCNRITRPELLDDRWARRPSGDGRSCPKNQPGPPRRGSAAPARRSL
jgi:hypothetical protein